MNADIDASADIDSTKIDLSSSGYLTTGTPTATITGDWTFEGQTNIDALVSSLATIGNINISTGAVTSLMTIAYLQSDYAEIASLATLANINVENVNNATYVSVPTSGWTNMEVFTSSGTWTKPASVDKVYVKVVGGGGGSGSRSGAGGGGGGYTEGLIGVTGNVTVTIGAAGVGGGNNGTAGGTSSFAGSTTPQATGGSGGTKTSSLYTSPGIGSSGTFNVSGGYGKGGSGYNGGDGGRSLLGEGGVGALNGYWTSYKVSGYGGGAGGGCDNESGRTGTAGIVIVYWNE